MPSISLFPKGFPTKADPTKFAPSRIPEKDLDLDTYFDHIKDGYWQDEVLAYRTKKIQKTQLRGVTPCGTFTKRAANAVKEPSGVIAIDIDQQDQIEGLNLNTVRIRLMQDSYTHAVHESASGNGGMVVYIKIDPKRHKDAFLGLEKYFANEYGVVIDKSCKDVSRFRFVSYDPDLFRNARSKTFKTYLKKNEKPNPNRSAYIHTSEDLDHVWEQIAQKGYDICHDYSDWIRCAMALANHYGGTKGRDLFHLVSQNSSKYDAKACDDMYAAVSKREYNDVSIGTLLFLAKQSGVEIKTPKTREIEAVVKQRVKAVGTNGGAATKENAVADAEKFLVDQKGYDEVSIREVSDQVLELSPNELNQNTGDVLTDLETFIEGLPLKYNEVTMHYEYEGREMKERDWNNLYISALKIVSDKLSQQRFELMVRSENVPKYNPFEQYFDRNKHRKSNGNFKALCKAIKHKQRFELNGREYIADDYLEIYLKKWLLGMISAMNGTYSLLILVLTGGQGTSKTKFFRTLLPDSLMQYYGETELDEGKDDKLLMTQKILLLDDEFGGKSKKDAKKLKSLSSKQFFNLRPPYGKRNEDIKRYAVLAGTSNDDEIINDPTGNRRIIPINIEMIDFDAIAKIDKDELFMELYREWQETGDAWMLTKEDIALLKECTTYNQTPSPEEELCNQFFEVPTEDEIGSAKCSFLSTTEIVNIITNRSMTRISINVYKFGAVLKKLGFEKKTVRDGNNVKGGYYVIEKSV
jgi:hypothetical protein